MSDERSTRRLVNSSSDEEVRSETSNRTIQSPDTLPHNEDQIANSKQETYSDQLTEAARLQPPESFEMDQGDSRESVESTFDIDRLEEELSLAINAELGKPVEQAPLDAESDQPSVASTPTTTEKIESDRPSLDDVATPPATDVTSEPTLINDQPTPSGAVQGTSWRVQLLLAGARPVEALSPRGRRLLEICAVSMAVWVPVVWLLAITDGLGFLKP